MTGKTTIQPGGLKRHRFDSPAAARHCTTASGRAAAARIAARDRRLVRLDGNVEVLADAARRLGMTTRRFAEIYGEGHRTSAAILARHGALAERP